VLCETDLCPADAPVRVRDARDEMLTCNTICASTVLLRKSIVDETGPFDPRRRFGEDWDLWIRMSSLCLFCAVPQVLVAYRVHSGNSVKNVEAVAQATSAILDEYLPPDGTDSEHRLRMRSEAAINAAHAMEGFELNLGQEDTERWLRAACDRARGSGEHGLVQDIIVNRVIGRTSLSREAVEAGCRQIELIGSEVARLGGSFDAEGGQRRFWYNLAAACVRAGNYRLAAYCWRRIPGMARRLRFAASVGRSAARRCAHRLSRGGTVDSGRRLETELRRLYEACSGPADTGREMQRAAGA
jgi:hypothetical protein